MSGVRKTMARLCGVLVVGAATVAVLPSPAAAAGPAKPAIFHEGTWYLRSSASTGAATTTFRYGIAGPDMPVMGDWNGDGDDTVGVARLPEDGTGSLTWHLRDTNSAGGASVAPFTFGVARFVAVDRLGSIPIVGDWDGDGDDTIGVAQYGDNLEGSITFLLRNTNSAGPPDVVLSYGRTDRDYPLVGDWDGNGTDTPGVLRGPNSWLLRNSASSGPASVAFTFGTSRNDIVELPVPGDWNGDGSDNPGLVRNAPATEPEGGFVDWLIRTSNTSGPATSTFRYGSNAFFVGLPVDYVPRLSYR